jgi:hypothetical protein
MLRPIVAEHGADRVYAVGLEVLGFPPTLDPSVNQVRSILAALTQPTE